MSLADLLVELEAAKDSQKAGAMEAYMRHQFSFLGVAVPERNKLYKKYFPEAKKQRLLIGIL
ncbi:MAG: DNA alkylation repair protein [Streptococcus mitis]|nr:DNA alkylation repair protein [Streptococcus mitis]